MKSPSISRGTYSNFYQNAGFFSLMVTKGQAKSEHNILSFPIGDVVFSSVVVSRKEASYVLKRFKKELDSKRAKA
jgi:hypothetical protein